jgi:hypothetical protein
MRLANAVFLPLIVWLCKVERRSSKQQTQLFAGLDGRAKSVA